MRRGLTVTERATVAIGQVTRTGLCGDAKAVATESAWCGDHGVLAYLYHQRMQKYHASSGVERGQQTYEFAPENRGAEWGAYPLALSLSPRLLSLSRWVALPLSSERRAWRLWGHAG